MHQYLYRLKKTLYHSLWFKFLWCRILTPYNIFCQVTKEFIERCRRYPHTYLQPNERILEQPGQLVPCIPLVDRHLYFGAIDLTADGKYAVTGMTLLHTCWKRVRELEREGKGIRKRYIEINETDIESSVVSRPEKTQRQNHFRNWWLPKRNICITRKSNLHFFYIKQFNLDPQLICLDVCVCVHFRIKINWAHTFQ